MYQLGETVETAQLGDMDLAALGFDPAYVRELERQAALQGLGLRIRLPKFVKKIGRGIAKGARAVGKTALKVAPYAAGGAVAYLAARKLALPLARRALARKPKAAPPPIAPRVAAEPPAAPPEPEAPPEAATPSPLQVAAKAMVSEALKRAPSVAPKLPAPAAELPPEEAPGRAPAATPTMAPGGAARPEAGAEAAGAAEGRPTIPKWAPLAALGIVGAVLLARQPRSQRRAA